MRGTVRLIVILIMVWGVMGCSIKATITDPQDNVYTYKGPKDVDLAVKKGDMEVKYSGKTAPWYESMLPFLFKAIPDTAVIK